MRNFLREHAGGMAVSVLLHGLLIGGLVLASLKFMRPPPPSLQPLPIDAVVVDSQVLHAAQRAQDEARAAAAADGFAAQRQHVRKFLGARGLREELRP